MTLYCHILPQKPFSKLLQSLKLTTGRKLALLTNYLGRREIIRPKSNRASQRDWVTNLHHHHSELYHRTWMAEENLSVLRQSNRTIKPVSIRHQSHGNGFLASWSCHTLFHLFIWCDDRSNAEVGWRLRYNFPGRSSICWVHGGLVRILGDGDLIRANRSRSHGSRDLSLPLTYRL